MSARSSLMDFQVPRITHEDVKENRGVFQIEPLDRGFGYTFGNSLRRVLLSSLEGAAVTSVKIEGFGEQAAAAGDGAAPEASLAHGMENFPIEELELGVRSYNCLKRAGIQTVGDLVSKSEGELNAIPNFGKKSIDEVIETLHARGLNLRED